MLTQYISREGGERLKEFKYSGTNESILYQYCLSHIAEFIVKGLPMWLAPNTITVTGFVVLLTAVISHVVLNPTFSEPIPIWLCFYSAFCLCIYQTLDNCDGKQARRTGSATPLGMLLDHGTDCLVQWLVGLMLLSTLNVGTGPLTFVVWSIVACLSFYFAIYQQEHTGVFKLGKINGVDEGLPFIQLIFVITGIMGPSAWRTNVPIINMPVNIVSTYVFCCVGFNEIFQFAKPAWEKLRYFMVILYSIRIPMTYFATVLILAIFAPEGVRKYQIILMAALGFQWSKIIIKLQRLSQKQLSWFAVQIALLTIFLLPDELKIPREPLLYATLLYSASTYIHCVLSFIFQITDILGIKVFSIGHKEI